MTPFERFNAQLMQQAGRMKSGAAIMAVIALAGCATQSPGQNEGSAAAGAATTPPLEVATEISKVANNISASLNRLAEVEEAGRKLKPAPRPKVAAGPLTSRVTILWRSGPVEQILSNLASDAGYTFKMVGQAPAIQLMVSVDVVEEPVIDILRSIGLQLGDSATVHVDTRNKLIEVVYASGR